jgi:uncharacterized protein (TIGR03437 family)
VGAGIVRVTHPGGESEALVTVGRTAPGIFPAGETGHAIVKLDGSLVSETNPVQPGEFIAIFATGLGQVTRQIEAGVAVPPAPPLPVTSPVEVSIGETIVRPTFAGLAPGFAGLYQVNVQIPVGLSAGTRPLRVVSEGVHSNEVTLPIR